MIGSGIPGLNIQWPWSQLLISGEKTIETRSYALPQRLQNVDLALIETPGPLGRRKQNSIETKIIGTIRFSHCYQYKSSAEWRREFSKHRVPANDQQFGYSRQKPKWAWVVAEIIKFEVPKSPPSKRGYVFSKNCLVDL